MRQALTFLNNGASSISAGIIAESKCPHRPSKESKNLHRITQVKNMSRKKLFRAATITGYEINKGRS
jgi:hypothetical protein